MVELLVSFAVAFLVLWLLAVFYFAVMNIKRVRDRGELTPFMYAIGFPMLWIGLVLDLLANVLVFTVLFLELPREPLVTGRLKRHKYHGTGWRHRLALFFERHLDPFDDKPGGHI
jgi:hypothetical protein